jgi:hypothetical protein
MIGSNLLLLMMAGFNINTGNSKWSQGGGLEPLYTVGKNVKLVQPPGKMKWGFEKIEGIII